MSGNLEATVVRLQLDLERAQCAHHKEMAELKKSFQAHQASAETERKNALAQAQRHFEMEKERAVDEAKKKQWCAQCGQEAIFYCCWNTAYCDYPCQQTHWPKHMVSCANANQNAETAATQDGSPATAPVVLAGDASNKPISPQKTVQVIV